MNKIILCDVDLTVVDPIPLWWHWMEVMVGHKLDYYEEVERRDGHMPYDVSECFSEHFGELSFDAANFWRNEGIYDLMYPVPYCASILKELHSMDYKIRFVSHCKGNHHKSKYRFLERNFPFLDGFAATKEKYMLHADVFIDDRVDHLNKMPSSVLKIQPITPYKQFEVASEVTVAADWSEIFSTILTHQVNNKW